MDVQSTLESSLNGGDWTEESFGISFSSSTESHTHRCNPYAIIFPQSTNFSAPFSPEVDVVPTYPPLLHTKLLPHRFSILDSALPTLMRTDSLYFLRGIRYC